MPTVARESCKSVRTLCFVAVASALGSCSLDGREVQIADRPLEAGGGAEPMPTEQREVPPIDATASPVVTGCEAPNCRGDVQLLQEERPSDGPVPLLPVDAGVESPTDVAQLEDKLLQGEPCSESGDCASGSCRATEGSGSVCCTPDCGVDEICGPSGNTCVTPKASRGVACVVDDECASGSCSDGVCCEEACDGVCETCAGTGICRAPLDDNACPSIRCSALDATCADITGDIQTNRCQSKGSCKSLDACGLAPAGVECLIGFCDNEGQCRAPTVNCGGACESTGLVPGRTCCSFNDTFELTCVDERSCGASEDRRVLCDESSDCSDGSVCCSSSSPAGTQIFCLPEADCFPQPGVRASLNQVCAAPGASFSPCPIGQECQPNPPGNHLPDWSFCRQTQPVSN